jgi:hypothetical protein
MDISQHIISAMMEIGVRPLYGDALLSMHKYYCKVAASDCSKLIYKAFVEDKSISNASVSARCLHSAIIHLYTGADPAF